MVPLGSNGLMCSVISWVDLNSWFVLSMKFFSMSIAISIAFSVDFLYNLACAVTKHWMKKMESFWPKKLGHWWN